ncbi:MAG TPA: DegV family protein [Methylomirabilota bacterium]|nr:DegV family protein [Methylomirabilota bacterium]
MAQSLSVLIADTDDQRRRDLGLALYEGGYEVVNAVNREEALRFTAGLDPALVVVHPQLDGISPVELYARLAGTGLRLPPFLVLDRRPAGIDETPAGSEFHFVSPDGLDPARFLLQVRLLLLAREIGGELGDDLGSLYGDLTRIAVGDLLRILERDRITGHVKITVGPGAGIWMDDGEVVQAYWGNLKGRKAFNRIAGLHQGAFVVELVPAAVERGIESDLGVLVSDAIEERLQLEEAFERLPSLNAKVGLQMGNDFFALEFTPVEREVLTKVQEARNLGDLVNRVTVTDFEAVQAVERLAAKGVLRITQPASRIHLVTDSTCDLLPSFARREGVTVVPLSVVFGSTVYKDGVDLLPDEFYQMLEGGDIFPSTSPPGKGEFLETYRRLIATGDIVSVHISAKQSLTARHAAEAAAEGANEFSQLRLEADGTGEPQVRVVDSKANSVGLGMLVVFAGRLIERGLGVDEIVHRLEDIRERLHFLFLVDTLEFLRKGGRIGQAQALIGSLLGIKPILGQVDGEVVPVDKVRGGKRAQARLLEILRERVNTGRPVFVATAHASAPQWGGQLKEQLVDTFDIVEMLEGEIGPVVGAHAGPGTVGCIVFEPTDEELELLRAPE